MCEKTAGKFFDVIFARAVIPASDAPRLCARGTNMRKNGATKQAMMKVLMSCAVVKLPQKAQSPTMDKGFFNFDDRLPVVESLMLNKFKTSSSTFNLRFKSSNAFSILKFGFISSKHSALGTPTMCTVATRFERVLPLPPAAQPRVRA